MNLGQAVAICLYELARDARAAARAPKPVTKAQAAELDRITESLVEILHQSGYVNPRTAGSTTLKIRRMVRRLDLGAQDARVWLGMLRQIRWRLGHGGKP
jgi:tRNA/rRNA methyltransferase